MQVTSDVSHSVGMVSVTATRELSGERPLDDFGKGGMDVNRFADVLYRPRPRFHRDDDLLNEIGVRWPDDVAAEDRAIQINSELPYSTLP